MKQQKKRQFANAEEEKIAARKLVHDGLAQLGLAPKKRPRKLRVTVFDEKGKPVETVVLRDDKEV